MRVRRGIHLHPVGSGLSIMLSILTAHVCVPSHADEKNTRAMRSSISFQRTDLRYAAVLNAALAALLIVLVVPLTSDPKIMGERVNSRSLHYLGWAAEAV